MEARAKLLNAPVSTKFSAELANVLRGKRVEYAEKYLERVLQHKEWVPLRKHRKKVGHRKGVRLGVKSGRYMDNVVMAFSTLLKQVKANAEHKGLNTERLRIKEINIGPGVRRFRLNRYRRAIRKKSTSIEMVVCDD